MFGTKTTIPLFFFIQKIITEEKKGRERERGGGLRLRSKSHLSQKKKMKMENGKKREHKKRI